MEQYRFLKHSIYFFLFFIVFYIETIEVGGIKFAIIWKGFFIVLIIFKLILFKKSLSSNKFIIYGYLFNFKKLLTLSTFTSFFPSLLQLSRSLIFPLLLSYFRAFYSRKKLLNIIKSFPVYIIISTIPFLLGIIEPLKQGYDLSRYGLDSFGFIGIFQNPHSASMTLAFSLLIIFHLIRNTALNYKKGLYVFLFILGSYALIQTYVRTGLAMFLIGLSVFYLYKIKISKLLRFIPVITFIAVGFYFYYQNNEAIQMRFQEKNIWHQDNTVELDNIGSGRFKIATYAITNWWNEGALSIFIGLGEELAREKMAINKGSAVFAHNGFVEILQTDGIFGILLYLNFIFLMYKVITKKINKKSQYYKLVLALFFMYLTGMFFQGGDNIFIYILLASSLTLLDENRTII